MCINPLAITDELSMRLVIFLIAFFQAHQYYYCSSHINLVPIKGLIELVGWIAWLLASVNIRGLAFSGYVLCFSV